MEEAIIQLAKINEQTVKNLRKMKRGHKTPAELFGDGEDSDDADSYDIFYFRKAATVGAVGDDHYPLPSKVRFQF